MCYWKSVLYMLPSGFSQNKYTTGVISFLFFSVEKTDFLIISSLLGGWLSLVVECVYVYLCDSIDSVAETQKNCQC